jgi:hypothetical protein
MNRDLAREENLKSLLTAAYMAGLKPAEYTSAYTAYCHNLWRIEMLIADSADHNYWYDTIEQDLKKMGVKLYADDSHD